MIDLVGQRLGDFEIARELGRGGMGIVYEARQVSLNRKVALKVLAGGPGLTAKAVQRFRREAEAAARLHHTNIVPVYATGEQDGTHFYAMELIEGPSLDHVLRQLRCPGADTSPSASLAATGPYLPQVDSPSASSLPLNASSLRSGSPYFDSVARMVAEVADALDYAHKNGVIHRDIKPSNLLLSPQGRLTVNDFGLARVLEQPGMTLTGEFVGTPAYTSPEQITAGRIPLDHRTDIYSLGATLYELLTLQPPFTGQQRDQVLAQIVQKEPKPPRQLNKKVPVDLETICLKALEKDPDRRYQTAGQLAEDLRRYVNRFAISARRAGPVWRLVKWARRRPAVAASLGCVCVAVGVALALACWAYHENQQWQLEKKQARAQLLDEKIRHAYQVASSGDLKRTEEAIQEIERLGASTGQVRLLRGVVAFFRSDSEAAIHELEQAVKLLPENVAARALLAMSYADYGQFERYEQLALEMMSLSPSTPEDFLFRGYAREVNEPGLGLGDVNEGIQRQDSPLGRALRAFVRSDCAIASGQRQDAEEALADANVARGMLPSNPLVLYMSLYARLVAAGIYDKDNLPEQRRSVLREAARDVQALEPFIDLPNSLAAMWLYYEEIGEKGEALRVARRALEKSGSPQASYLVAVSLYRQGKFTQALECLDQRPQADLQGDVTRVLILAELPNGPRLALDGLTKLAAKYPHPLVPKYRADLLLLLGKKGQALASMQKFRPPFALSQDWKAFYEATRQFGCGELSEKTYLDRARPSRWMQVTALRHIGLIQLANGDRAGARDNFKKAVATRTIWSYEWFWAQLLLSHMSHMELEPKRPVRCP
jgi:tetratricopeptide (TPR) repeat protein